MKPTVLFFLAFTLAVSADDSMKSALLFHASFDQGGDAEVAAVFGLKQGIVELHP